MNKYISASTACIAFGAVFAPSVASAITLVQVLGVFHLFVGLFVVATIITFVTGLFVYFVRLGTWPTHRDTAIEVLEWAVVMLFILIIILALVRFFQSHSQTALLILAVLLIVAVAFLILRTTLGAGKPKKKEGSRPSPSPAPRR